MKFSFGKEVGGDGKGKTYVKRAVFITVNCRKLSNFLPEEERKGSVPNLFGQLRRLGSLSSHDENDNVKKTIGNKAIALRVHHAF